MTTSAPRDLDELLPAIAMGDAVAFGKLAAAIELDLRRSLRGFAAKVDVEAIVQEGLLRTWQVAPRFVPDGKPNGLARLCQRITRNAALDELRKRREVIAYCRGPFCLMSFEAVQLLRKKGIKARRLEDGMPEWRVAGLPVEEGSIAVRRG